MAGETSRDKWMLDATKVVYCNKECGVTPMNCPFRNFEVDGCSVVKTKSKDVFRRVRNAVAERGEGVRGFYCQCSRKEHAVSGKVQEHIHRRELPKLNYPGGEDESNYLRKQRECNRKDRRAS